MQNHETKIVKEHFSETLEKGLGILTLFNENQRGMTIAEISIALDINRTSIYRYLNSYCKLGYLRKDPQTKRYKLGPRTVALAQSFLLGSDLVELIKPVVDACYDRLGIHIGVGALYGNRIYIIYRRETKETRSFRLFTTGMELHQISMGKAALAFLPGKEQKELIGNLGFVRKTTTSIMNKSDLMVDLRRTLKRGYAINNEEYIPGLIAIGAPLINPHTAKVQGAISFDSCTSRFTVAEFERTYAKTLTALAKEVSALLPAS